MSSISYSINAERAWRMVSLLVVTLMLLAFVVSSADRTSPAHLQSRGLHDVHLDERSLLSALESAGASLLDGGAKGASGGGGGIFSTIGQLFSGNTSGLIAGLASDIAVPAGFLGTGLAMGVIAGMMNMSVPTTNATGFNLVAQNLGSGLTKTLVGSISVIPNTSDTSSKAVMTNTTMSMTLGAGTINGAALALAQGLGTGASNGLKLTQASTNATFNTSGINGAAGNLGYGLTSTFLTNLNTSSLVAKAGGQINFADILSGKSTLLGSSLNDIAAGAGTGLGSGVSLGLGLQNQAAMPVPPNGSAGAAQQFTSGLTSSFLQGGTLSKLATSLMGSGGPAAALGLGGKSTDMNSSSSSVLSNLNIAAVAQGFAVGLLDGAGNTLAGQPTPPMQMLSFNDSVGGAATGFGLGLGSQGTKLVKQVLANPSVLANLTGTATKRDVLAERGIIYGKDMIPASRVSIIQRRAAGANNTSLIAALNATTLDPILQMGIDTIGCAGVGGLASIGLGLIETGTIDPKPLTNMLKMNKNIKNNQTFVLTNNGNNYTINLAKMDIKINGVPIKNAIIALVLHIVFAVIAYFMLAPLVIILRSTSTVLHVSNNSSLFPNTPFLTTWTPRLLYAIGPPLAIITPILGFVVKGSTLHFVSAHEILGIIILVPTIATVAAAPLRLKNNALKATFRWGMALTMLIAVLVLFTGFVELAAYSFCAVQALPVVVWVVLGVLILGPLMLGVGVAGLEGLLVRQRGRGRGRDDEVVGEIVGSYFDVEEGSEKEKKGKGAKVVVSGK
ncbi:cytochrome b b6 petb protein [Rutstroemia sp. NJR-2017a WRK4]|nr:cytochrome b b6 petb protein [Rutstroemia sp. NJR-2017a WRK4]